MSDFWFYPFPVLVLIALVAWNDLSVKIQLCKLEERICKLEKRIRKLEQAEEARDEP